jgi:hypothetical protein
MPTNSKKKTAQTPKAQFVRIVKKPYVGIASRVKDLQSRRPHRSFRRTLRRDYARSLKLPGYIAFTHYVNQTLWKNRKALLLLALVYSVFSVVLIGLGSQDTYNSLSSTLQTTSQQVFQGNLSQVGQAGLLFLAIAGTGLSSTPTEGQQIYAVLLGLLIWLTTVWLLRNIMAGHRVKMRDGLYSAGAPLISTFIIAAIFVVQLIPIALAVIGYYAAQTSGLLNGGVEAMLFWIVAALLSLISLYWVTSTFFALIIVTLPGMYPFRALRTAGDLVIGRRVRILLRILWMFLCIIVAWAIVMIVFILLDTWLGSVWAPLQGVPVIPVLILVLTTLSLLWTSSYVYLLYRKVVDDDARPAL